MKILKTSCLTAEQLNDINKLEALCREKDCLCGSLFLTPELNDNPEIPCFFLMYDNSDGTLAAFLSLFIPSAAAAEVSACTHPAKRRQGCFNALLKSARNVLLQYGISRFCFVTEPSSVTAAAVLARLSAAYAYSEYFMIYSNASASVRRASTDSAGNAASAPYRLIPAGRAALNRHISIHSAAFNNTVPESRAFITEIFSEAAYKKFSFCDSLGRILGCCYADVSGSKAVVFGVCISPEAQGQRLGQLMVAMLIKDYLLPCGKPVILEVSSQNAKAVHIYKKLGFTAASQFDYWFTTE